MIRPVEPSGVSLNAQLIKINQLDPLPVDSGSKPPLLCVHL